jgi:hypothetical protein
MLASAKPGPDFSRGVRAEGLAPYFSRRAPHPAVRELTLGDRTYLAALSVQAQVRSSKVTSERFSRHVGT